MISGSSSGSPRSVERLQRRPRRSLAGGGRRRRRCRRGRRGCGRSEPAQPPARLSPLRALLLVSASVGVTPRLDLTAVLASERGTLETLSPRRGRGDRAVGSTRTSSRRRSRIASASSARRVRPRRSPTSSTAGAVRRSGWRAPVGHNREGRLEARCGIPRYRGRSPTPGRAGRARAGLLQGATTLG